MYSWALPGHSDFPKIISRSRTEPGLSFGAGPDAHSTQTSIPGTLLHSSILLGQEGTRAAFLDWSPELVRFGDGSRLLCLGLVLSALVLKAQIPTALVSMVLLAQPWVVTL